MMAAIMFCTQAAPEWTYTTRGDPDYCDWVSDFYLKRIDIMYDAYGSDWDGPRVCREAYQRKRKEEIEAKEREAEPDCAKSLSQPQYAWCAVDCANSMAHRVIAACLSYLPLCRPQLCGQCNRKFDFLLSK